MNFTSARCRRLSTRPSAATIAIASTIFASCSQARCARPSAALAALATPGSVSRLTGIAHLRGHETDRLAALNLTRQLLEGYANLDAALLARPLVVTCKTSYATRGSQFSPSTVGREIMYSVAHAVHHYALIGVMGAILGSAMPPVFGIAPSTLKHHAETAQIAA